MYAIIRTGGKQYKVEKGDVIDVELTEVKDQKIEFSEILLYHDGKAPLIGLPALEKYKVIGEVIDEESMGPKVIAYKYKRRKNYKKKIGHRQKYKRVKITEIKAA